jgi:serine/tyrosine/threonine adenylyltransferase
VAPNWIRFGSFELFYARDEVENLQKLVDYCCQYFFIEETKHHLQSKCQKLLEKVVIFTAEMIAHWQAVGFCHGVMNTDNFSIMGVTIDYGPFQFLDSYDPEYICNHSDEKGRYRYSAQPGVGLWNLTRLATVLSPIIQKELGQNATMKDVSDVIKPILELYISRIKEKYDELLCQKFGFKKSSKEILETVVHPALELMEKGEMDYAIFLRKISHTNFVPELITNEILGDWISASYKGTLEFQEIEEEHGQSLSSQLSIWYTTFRAAHRITNVEDDDKRRQKMLSKNPKFILRNHFAQAVIEKAESGDYTAIDRYLTVLLDPFSEGSVEQSKEFGGKVPNSSRNFKCSCSS